MFQNETIELNYPVSNIQSSDSSSDLFPPKVPKPEKISMADRLANRINDYYHQVMRSPNRLASYKYTQSRIDRLKELLDRYSSNSNNLRKLRDAFFTKNGATRMSKVEEIQQQIIGERNLKVLNTSQWRQTWQNNQTKR